MHETRGEGDTNVVSLGLSQSLTLLSSQETSSLLLSDSTEVDESAISNFGAHGCI
jgi:hypothetical protein